MAGTKASKKTTSARARKPRSAIINCEESLDITVAGDIHGKLSRALEEKRPVIIDTAKVKRTDAAILQLFCAFSRAVKHAKTELQWKNPSEEFMAAAKRLDLTALLGLPVQGIQGEALAPRRCPGVQGSDL